MKPVSKDRPPPELFWAKVVMRKWLNITTLDSDFSADSLESDTDSDPEDFSGEGTRESRFRRGKREEEELTIPIDAILRPKRRLSETFRAQYINTKEIRICVGTWNAGGNLPPEDLDIDDWLDINQPADIYVLGFQEIIPLNAGNIFGSEDSRPVPRWESIIRDTLNRIRPEKKKFKCYSDPPSPSRFKPSDDAPILEEELIIESDSHGEEEIHPIDEESDIFYETGDGSVASESFPTNYGSSGAAHSDLPLKQNLDAQVCSSASIERSQSLKTYDTVGTVEASALLHNIKFRRTLSGAQRIDLRWPEPPVGLLAKHVLDIPKSFKSVKSFKSTKSFGTYNSFKLAATGDNRVHSDVPLLAQLDLESIMHRKRRPQFVRIISKQMVGIFLTIWVRRGLRRHIENVKVSTVGVGAMGYIGNKGAISVSMSVHQTLFCFICTHLTSGEKEGDAIKRNADVQEIHRRTKFHSPSAIGLPKSIYDHERIIWLGDLNYRINMSYDKTRELISKKDWSHLEEGDQLTRELRRGRTFDGWREGALNFPPTYKFEMNSDKYCGEDPKVGRRTPSWCDRILSYGKGMQLLSYRRTDIRFSDHRPVTASYLVEVEVLSPRKLQRALTFTTAEVEDVEVDLSMSYLGLPGEASGFVSLPLPTLRFFLGKEAD